MSDADERALERRAAAWDPSATDALARIRCRSGRHEPANGLLALPMPSGEALVWHKRCAHCGASVAKIGRWIGYGSRYGFPGLIRPIALCAFGLTNPADVAVELNDTIVSSELVADSSGAYVRVTHKADNP